MRTLYFILFVILSFCSKSIAQQHEQLPDSKKNYFGVKAGVNLSTFSGDEESKMQLGANGGIYALYMESEHIGIQPELQYALQGTGVSNGGHIFMHYLSIPVMLKVYPTPNFSFQAGPYAAFLLSAKYEYEAVDIKLNNTKGQDFGFAYGFSFGNEEKITFGIRHHVGLTSIYKDSKLRNQSIQASVGFCISK
ncbi:porin family protein [uncultured Pontibacter sp.]|uniref:porin family protein n=1 Tax=uncultured Pontibacter sp. TaxID=453356 RepID=UPI0026213DEE|nr:porin family protein [uncultured Pontibacter sp.]